MQSGQSASTDFNRICSSPFGKTAIDTTYHVTDHMTTFDTTDHMNGNVTDHMTAFLC